MPKIEISEDTYNTLKNLKDGLKESEIDCTFDDIIMTFYTYLKKYEDIYEILRTFLP